MHLIATIFRAILTDFQKVMATIAAKDRPHAELLVRIHCHINRTMVRFERLVTHWRNSTLPKPRTPSTTVRAKRLNTPRLPTGYAWLIRSVDHYNARAHASQLQHFLATPEFIQFLAEVPRANRILRPLTKSLGIQMPGDPPPPMPKPAPPPKPAKNPWLSLPSLPEPVALTVERPNRNFYPPQFSKAR